MEKANDKNTPEEKEAAKKKVIKDASFVRRATSNILKKPEKDVPPSPFKKP